MSQPPLLTLVIASLLCPLFAGADTSSELQIDSAQLTLIEHADISASEAGLLSQLEAREGDTVSEGTVLGQLDDREAKLVRDRAQTGIAAPRVIHRESVADLAKRLEPITKLGIVLDRRALRDLDDDT